MRRWVFSLLFHWWLNCYSFAAIGCRCRLSILSGFLRAWGRVLFCFIVPCRPSVLPDRSEVRRVCGGLAFRRVAVAFPLRGISEGPEAGVDCRLSDYFPLRSRKYPFFFFVQIWGLLAAHRRPVVSAQFFRIDVFPVRGSPVRSCRSFFRCRSGRRSLSGGSQEAERAGDLWAGIRRLSNWQAGQVWLHFAKLASGASCG